MGRCRGAGAINRGLIALISLARCCLTHSLGRSLPIVCYETAFLPPVPPSPFPHAARRGRDGHKLHTGRQPSRRSGSAGSTIAPLNFCPLDE